MIRHVLLLILFPVVIASAQLTSDDKKVLSKIFRYTKNQIYAEELGIVSKLINEVKEAYPDPDDRIRKVYDYSEQTKNSAVYHFMKWSWPSLGNSEQRGKFLVDSLNSAEAEQVDYFYKWLKDELMMNQYDYVKYTNFNNLGIAGEEVYQGNDYLRSLMRSEEGVDERLAGTWFSLAPNEAAKLAAHPDDKQTRKVLDEVMRIRVLEDKGGTREEDAVIWPQLQAKLLELWNTRIPALQTYVAGVMNQANDNPHKVAPLLAKEMEKSDSPLIHYLLSKKSNKYNVTLSDLSGTEKVKLRYDNPNLDLTDEKQEILDEQKTEQAVVQSEATPMAETSLPVHNTSFTDEKTEREARQPSTLPIALIVATALLGLLLLYKLKASRK